MTEILRLQSSGAVGLPADSAIRLVRDPNWSTYKPSLGTTNAVLLGELDQVRDSALRAAILSWPSAVEESAPERIALHQLGDGILLADLARVARATGRGWEADNEHPLLDFGLPAGEFALLVVRDAGIAARLRHIQSVHGGYEGELLATRETLVRNLDLLARRSTAAGDG